MTDWWGLATDVDAVCDDTFGEPIRFVPWVKASYVEGYQDNDRAARSGVGILLSPEATLQNVAGATRTVIGSSARMVTQDITVSVQNAVAEGFGQYDRVEFLHPNREGLLCEISYISPGPTGRKLIHLIKVDA